MGGTMNAFDAQREISHSTNSRTPDGFLGTRMGSLVPRLVPEGKAHMVQDCAVSVLGTRLQLQRSEKLGRDCG